MTQAGVIRTLHHRCQNLYSSEEAKIKELDHLKKVLTVSGYSKAAWNTAVSNKPTSSPQRHSTSMPSAFKGSVTLPYVGPATEAVARNVRKTDITVHIKPANTIRNKLVHPKDKLIVRELVAVNLPPPRESMGLVFYDTTPGQAFQEKSLHKKSCTLRSYAPLRVI